jgi:chemotaxis protein histidine kinase CheA
MFERLVEAIAKQYNKEALLTIEDTAGKIDQQLFDKLLVSIEHLLLNAVIHGLKENQPGSIKIFLRYEGPEVVISVTDDGVGMSDEVQQQVLVKGFTTAEKSRFAGRGNGLAGVSDQVKQLGGKIEISSAPEQGSTFTIRIPI